jgi:hypothetical protein
MRKKILWGRERQRKRLIREQREEEERKWEKVTVAERETWERNKEEEVYERA